MIKLFYRIAFVLVIALLFVHCKNESVNNTATEEKNVVASNADSEVNSIKVDSTKLKASLAAKVTRETPAEKLDTADKANAIAKVEEKKEVAKPKPKKKKKKKRSKIKFEETTHKFGTIKTGDKVSHKFKFKNNGDAPLVIRNVDVSCGCTFPSYPFIPIKPGAEGEIDVTFNSEHKIGRQKPTITVVTNGRPRTIKLYMEGFVE